MVMIIRREDPGQADIVPLLEDGERNSAELYPAESNHHLPLEALRAPDVRFFVGRDEAGRPLATGAIVLHDEWVEIKRMWVVPRARGRGLSREQQRVEPLRHAREDLVFQQGAGVVHVLS